MSTTLSLKIRNNFFEKFCTEVPVLLKNGVMIDGKSRKDGPPPKHMLRFFTIVLVV